MLVSALRRAEPQQSWQRTAAAIIKWVQETVISAVKQAVHQRSSVSSPAKHTHTTVAKCQVVNERPNSQKANISQQILQEWREDNNAESYKPCYSKLKKHTQNIVGTSGSTSKSHWNRAAMRSRKITLSMKCN